MYSLRIQICGSRVSVWAAAQWGGFGWGETKEQDFLNAIHTALDKGVNYFDTADTYGLGQSERTLAKGLGSQRKML